MINSNNSINSTSTCIENFPHIKQPNPPKQQQELQFNISDHRNNHNSKNTNDNDDKQFEYNQQKLNKICQGIYKARCLNLVITLNIPLLLIDGQKHHVDELARQVDVDSTSLFKVMRALSTMGIFIHHDDDVDENDEGSVRGKLGGASVDSQYFSQSELSHMLLDEDMRNVLLFECGDFNFKSWTNINDTVKTGKSALPQTFGQDNYMNCLHQNKKDLTLFENGMTGMTRPTIPGLLQQSDFSSFEIVADIGGSQGVLIQEILKHNDNIKVGINFDMPQTIENNRRNLSRENVDPRFQEIEGCFFKEVPAADCYILSKIMLHDTPSIKILECIKKSIRSNGKVYIYDCILEKNTPNYSYKCWVDVHLWHSLNSSGRTKKEWKELVKKAGFKVDQFIGDSLIIISLEEE